jgi:hypothetical protein
MKRLLIDIGAFLALAALGWLVGVVAIDGMFVGLMVLAFVGFVRGSSEYRSLPSPKPWWGSIEWAVIVFVEYALSCYLDVRSHPLANFETVFEFGLLLVLVPGEILGTVAYWWGVKWARAIPRE